MTLPDWWKLPISSGPGGLTLPGPPSPSTAPAALPTLTGGPPVPPYAGGEREWAPFDPPGYSSEGAAIDAFYGAGRLANAFSSPLAPGSMASTAVGTAVGLPFLSLAANKFVNMAGKANQRATLEWLASTGMPEVELAMMGEKEKRGQRNYSIKNWAKWATGKVKASGKKDKVEPPEPRAVTARPGSTIFQPPPPADGSQEPAVLPAPPQQGPPQLGGPQEPAMPYQSTREYSPSPEQQSRRDRARGEGDENFSF